MLGSVFRYYLYCLPKWPPVPRSRLEAFAANQAPALDFPTHLLVVISPGVPRPKDAHLVENLKKVLAQGWLVSVNRSDGSFTPYSTGNSLAFALSASNSEPMTAAQAKLAAQ